MNDGPEPHWREHQPWRWVAIPGALVVWTIPFAALGAASALIVPVLFVGRAPLPRTLTFAMVPALLGLLLLLAVSYIAGVALARYANRAFPFRLKDGQSRVPVALGLVAILVGIVGVAWFPLDVALSTDAHADGEPANHKLSILLAAIAPVLLCAGARVKADHRDGSEVLRQTLARPFVLFLRRFSSFADESVLQTVLRALPADVPCVLLVGHRGSPGTWDPLLIGYAAVLKTLFRGGGPVFVTARDSEWQHVVSELISQASCVVLDDTDGSAAIEIEKAIIESRSASSRVLVIRESKGPHSDASAHASSRVLHYERTWTAALPRMVVGFVVVFVALFFVAFAAGPTIQQGPAAEDGDSVVGLAILIGFAPAMLLFLRLFGRAVVEPEDAQRLVAVLREVLQRGGRPPSARTSTRRVFLRWRGLLLLIASILAFAGISTLLRPARSDAVSANTAPAAARVPRAAKEQQVCALRSVALEWVTQLPNRSRCPTARDLVDAKLFDLHESDSDDAFIIQCDGDDLVVQWAGKNRRLGDEDDVLGDESSCNVETP